MELEKSKKSKKKAFLKSQIKKKGLAASIKYL